MNARRLLGWGLLALCTACSGAKQAVREPSELGTGGSGVAAREQSVDAKELASRRYVHQAMGFEFIQPGGDWLLDEVDEQSPEGLVTAVVLDNPTAEAKVVLQVAPAVASPAQFAERLVVGLSGQPGFVTSEIEPLPMSDSAVGFYFQAGHKVRGRVVVRDGGADRIFMMLATWPATAPDEVPQTVNALFESVRPLPIAPEQV